MPLPSHVKIVEVGPRDGLQNEAQPITLDPRVEVIDRLTEAGLPVIEAGSFVSPKWVPQMAQSDTVFQRIKRREGVSYPFLVPNMKGFEAAKAAGVAEIAIFGAASETFSQKNINCSIAESLERFRPVTEAARENGMKIRGYISCVLGCPYEGAIAPAKVAEIAARLAALGCYEISLGDTIGVGTPIAARTLIREVMHVVPRENLALHFHDTYGQALANIFACLEEGIAVVDASVAGLGGCPYAKGATGNVATEDVVYMLNGMGIETGIDLKKLTDTGTWISNQLHRANGSKAGLAIAGSAECAESLACPL